MWLMSGYKVGEIWLPVREVGRREGVTYFSSKIAKIAKIAKRCNS